jgi:hypothetical protein
MCAEKEYTNGRRAATERPRCRGRRQSDRATESIIDRTATERPRYEGSDSQSRMDCFAAGEIQVTQSVEIQTVVDVACIGTAPPLPDELPGLEPLEVVGHEVSRSFH